MSQIEQTATRQRHTPWDAVMAAVLGLMLLAAGWINVRAYLPHRGGPMSGFAFLEPPGGESVGNDELYRQGDSYVVLSNFAGPEKNGPQHFRHVLGPLSTLLISTHLPHADLDFQYYNGVEDQNLTIFSDGKVIEQLTHQPKGLIVRKYTLAMRQGINDITLVFARYNHGGVELSPDSRLLAGTFTRLELTLY